ncbi:Os06g0354600, partial [Oryza sativa Japonica Group]
PRADPTAVGGSLLRRLSSPSGGGGGGHGWIAWRRLRVAVATVKVGSGGRRVKFCDVVL